MADKDEKQIKTGYKAGVPIYSSGTPVEPVHEPKTWNPSSYTKVKGIGKKTVKDIARIYNSEEELINALLNDEVPFEQDVIDALLSHFNDCKEENNI